MAVLMAYMSLVGRRLLPGGSVAPRKDDARTLERSLERVRARGEVPPPADPARLADRRPDAGRGADRQPLWRAGDRDRAARAPRAPGVPALAERRCGDPRGRRPGAGGGTGGRGPTRRRGAPGAPRPRSAARGALEAGARARRGAGPPRVAAGGTRAAQGGLPIGPHAARARAAPARRHRPRLRGPAARARRLAAGDGRLGRDREAAERGPRFRGADASHRARPGGARPAARARGPPDPGGHGAAGRFRRGAPGGGRPDGGASRRFRPLSHHGGRLPCHPLEQPGVDRGHPPRSGRLGEDGRRGPGGRGAAGGRRRSLGSPIG